MKPPPFEYRAPGDLEEALDILRRHGSEAKVLAGGQSLVPTLSFRLARPAMLVDLNRVPELAYVEPAEDGGLRLGAMTRQRALERDPQVAARSPLLPRTLPLVAHPQIRNRGTVGGSLAHADPAAELPAVLVALGGWVEVASAGGGRRRVAGRDFYLGLFATDLGPEELLVEVGLPSLRPRTGWSIQEVARRHGDYALAGAVAEVGVDAAGRCDHVRLVIFSVGECPVVAESAGGTLLGREPSSAVLGEAAAAAARDDVEPHGDIHAAAAYRRHLVEVLARRALGEAAAEAASGGPS